MKKIIFLICLFSLIGCKSKQTSNRTSLKETDKSTETELVKLSPANVDVTKKNKAYELGKRVLMTCNTSSFKPFTISEATEKVIQNTTQIRLTKTCLKFRLRYGNFKDIKLIEVLKDQTDNSLTFRYKADFEKEIANKELRVTMNSENKVSAIVSKDWIDEYQ